MPDLGEAWAFLKNSERIVAADEVAAAVDRVAAELERAYRDRYPLVLAVMGGAVVFAGWLLPKLRLPLDFDYLHATRYGAATAGGGIRWRVEPPEGVRGRDILVIDDILDGGQTLAAIRTRLLDLGAARVQ